MGNFSQNYLGGRRKTFFFSFEWTSSPYNLEIYHSTVSPWRMHQKISQCYYFGWNSFALSTSGGHHLLRYWSISKTQWALDFLNWDFPYGRGLLSTNFLTSLSECTRRFNHSSNDWPCNRSDQNIWGSIRFEFVMVPSLSVIGKSWRALLSFRCQHVLALYN